MYKEIISQNQPTRDNLINAVLETRLGTTKDVFIVTIKK